MPALASYGNRPYNDYSHIEIGLTMSTKPQKKEAAAYKIERLEARVSAQEKALFTKAAAIQGRTLSEFVVSTLHDASSRVIESYEIMRLTEQDRKTFIDALLNTPEPSKNLKAAARRYFKHTKNAT